MSTKDRHDIRIEVKTAYREAESRPEQDRYVFSYTITIRNAGSVPAKLLSRHWVIRDANDRTQEVIGDGVVGQQPYLRPGEAFQYTSATVMNTPVGSMRGTYHMVDEDGLPFEAEIPMFTLHVPNMLH